MLVLINLDSALERRRAMSRQLADSGLAFERVGVDLRFLSAAEVEREVSHRAPGFRFDRKALSNAEIGCWLSHLTAWQRLLRDSRDAVCTVIEDDLTLAPGFADAVRSLAHPRRGDAGCDLVYLGTSSRNVSQRRHVRIEGHCVHQPIGVILNTWGYSVTREYIERFFGDGRRTIRLPIDHFLGGRGRRMPPRIGVLLPAVVREDPVLGKASQIGPYTRRIDRSRIFEKIRRRVLASPMSAFYYSLYRYL